MTKRTVLLSPVLLLGLPWVVNIADAQLQTAIPEPTLTLRLFSDVPVALETADSLRQALTGEVEFLVSESSQVTVIENDDGYQFANAKLQIVPGIRITHGNVSAVVSELHWRNEVPEASLSSLADSSAATLELRGFRVGTSGRNLVAAAESVAISQGLALQLGDASLAGVSLGMAMLNRNDSSLPAPDGDAQPVNDVAAPGPDMNFCQLYGLAQFGRLGDIVGLAVATTSWNVGGRDMIWMQNPDSRHPMIVWNLYRLKNDRFEQIGMSHVKHGFFALGDHQCDNGSGGCHYEPGHGAGDWLGQQCTDTYGAGLNATQSGLGPRYEINSWTGGYTFAGSHLASGHAHNAIQHRCQVRDADLVAAQNPGATYYVEGQYITTDDVEQSNSISWKPVTVSGVAGGTFTFGMTGSSTQPNMGAAIYAWPGAMFTTIAQQVPVVRFTSPDGRCVLGSKATDLGGGQWHYEYALYNLDMHRKASSFHIPVASGVTVSNVGFSAVMSHDEPYSNTPWTPVVDSLGVTWSTANNPIRWGMLYNFRFDANSPPGEVTATVGLYEPGTPSTISGNTQGPFATNAAPDPLADPSGIQKCRFISAVLPEANVAAGAPTALRVRLANLHDVNPPYTAGVAADFSAFEGEVRWVGPPTQYVESTSNPTTFHAATLQCAPFYQDWSTVGVLHITGPEIVPSSVYTLENVAVSCQGNEADCTEVSAALEIATNRWADLVAPFSPEDPSIQPDITDVSGLVDKFRSAPGAPIKVQALLSGDVPALEGDVDFTEVSVAVDAFRGLPFPYSGPAACP